MQEISPALMSDVFEWSATVVSLLGAALVCLNTRISPWGFLVYLFANILSIAFALLNGHYGVVVQQIGFALTSVVGVYRTGLLAHLLRAPCLAPRGLATQTGTSEGRR
jgi:nicotinamide riboside transporter PnuC